MELGMGTKGGEWIPENDVMNYLFLLVHTFIVYFGVSWIF